MKTRVFKKVLSIVCVLAMLLSICVVGFSGVASAAESYTFNTNGVEEIKQYTAGETLHTPTTSTPGVAFEGWYPSVADFSNPAKKVTKAGEAKLLYAKFSGLVLNADAEGWKYNPHSTTSYIAVQDPTDSSNTVIKFNKNGNSNFGVPVYQGVNAGFEYKLNTTYEISYRYYCEDLDIEKVQTRNAALNVMLSSSIGIGQDGGKDTSIKVSVTGPVEIEDRKWTYSSIKFTTPSAVPSAKDNSGECKYLLICKQIGKDAGNFYIDDIIISEVVNKEYTFSDKGVETKDNLTAGDPLPIIEDRYFLGWYEETLTVKYTKVPAGTTKLVAKYSQMSSGFDDNGAAIYDPNDADAYSVAKDPADNSNNVLTADVVEGTKGFAVRGALGINLGYKLTSGNMYRVTFDYKVTGLQAGQSINIDMYGTAVSGIGNGLTDKIKIDNSGIQVNSNSTAWQESGNIIFTVPVGLSAEQNILYFAYTAAAGTNAKLYIDNFSVIPSFGTDSIEDVKMDFENNFKWSVDSANNYKTGSGNGYVTRGDIIKETGGNNYFRIRHFGSKESYHYFTVNNGSKQFATFHYGIYTVEFDYKIEHAETPSKIGIALVKPADKISDAKFKELTVVDSYSSNTLGRSREDKEWKHVSYTFGCDLTDIEDYTSIAIFVYNSTNVPEYDQEKLVCTSVAFDNVFVKSYAKTDDKGLIKFDSNGGSGCADIVAVAGKPVGALPIPERYGYDFLGWKYDDNGTQKDFTKDTIVPSFYTPVTANWKLKEGAVELTFRTNVDEYDKNVGTVVAFAGKPIVGFPTKAPTATGNTFVGWYYDTGFTKPVDPKVAPNQNSNIYAKWDSKGTIVDFEKYPQTYFKTDGYGLGNEVTDRIKIQKLDDGNHVMYYNFAMAANKDNVNSIAAAMLHTGEDFVPVMEGIEYTVSFKYKVIQAKGKGAIGFITSNSNGPWVNRQEQDARLNYGDASENWVQTSVTFTPKYNHQEGTNGLNNRYLSIGCSNNCKVYIDDIVVQSTFNYMNVYGSSIIFDTQGGKEISPISGDPGTAMNLPKPVKSGYKFMGWYTDVNFKNKLDDNATYPETPLFLYAKWKLGKLSESFEEFPNAVKSLGVAGSYVFYTKTAAAFDPSNVHSGETSLFRNGTSAGVSNFTVFRSSELALTPGDTYTLSFYVKPSAIGDANGTISMISMGTYTGIGNASDNVVIAKVAELKEGEWNKIDYTFTAKTKFVGLSTTANNDMYFDDITVTLKDYTGEANTGDSSINPIIVLAIVVICAGALLITGKKVFSK